jgi:hypothetical protein
LLEVVIVRDLQRYQPLAWVYAVLPSVFFATLVIRLATVGFSGAMWFWWVNIVVSGGLSALVLWAWRRS